jgi:hypothetical protein
MRVLSTLLPAPRTDKSGLKSHHQEKQLLQSLICLPDVQEIKRFSR